MRADKIAEKLPHYRPTAEPTRAPGEMPSKATVDSLKELDANRDGKVDRAEFTESTRYQSADEQQRDILSRAYAAVAGDSGVLETEESFEALASMLSEPEAPSEPKSKNALEAAYESVKGFFGNLFSKMKKAASDFVSWAGKQLNKLTNGFFEQFQTDVVRRPEQPEASAVRSRLRETEKEEKEALAKLEPQDRKAYQAIASEAVSDPVAHLTLRELLLDGRLPGGKDLGAGKSLLANLAELSKQPLADGIDRQELLADVLAQLADPIMISQEQQNTCGPTTGQLLLAMQEPAEYVRLAAGLASPEGSVKLQNDDTIERKSDWNDLEDDGRTVANRLFQSALMEYANGRFDYSNVKDARKVSVGPLSVDIPGLLPNEMVKLVEGLTGRDYQVKYSVMSDRISPAFQAAIDQAGPGNEVPVLLNYNVGGDGVKNLSPHYVLITGFDAESGMVCVSNPWGREEKISPQELQRHMIAVMPEA